MKRAASTRSGMFPILLKLVHLKNRTRTRYKKLLQAQTPIWHWQRDHLKIFLLMTNISLKQPRLDPSWKNNQLLTFRDQRCRQDLNQSRFELRYDSFSVSVHRFRRTTLTTTTVTREVEIYLDGKKSICLTQIQMGTQRTEARKWDGGKIWSDESKGNK